MGRVNPLITEVALTNQAIRQVQIRQVPREQREAPLLVGRSLALHINPDTRMQLSPLGDPQAVKGEKIHVMRPPNLPSFNP